VRRRAPQRPVLVAGAALPVVLRSAAAAAVVSAACLATGIAVVYAPTAIVALGLLIVGSVVAWVRPRTAIVVSIALYAVYLGVYLYYRVSVAGVPVSGLDASPLLLAVAALSLRWHGAAGARARRSSVLVVCVYLFVSGLVLGTLVGLADHAQGYQLLRVVRIEGELLVVLVACLLAGGSREWQSAVRTGLYVAAMIAAVLLIVSYVYVLTFGEPIWARFPFGHTVDDFASSVDSGQLGAARDNKLATYMMLPAFVAAGVRMRGWDPVVFGLVLAAALVSLSRGFWGATFVCLLLVVVFRAGAMRSGMAAYARLAIGAVPLLVLLFAISGSIFATRLDQAQQFDDSSTLFRQAETRAALSAVTASPSAVVLGTGAGVVIQFPQLRGRSPSEVSSLLEDSLLARWTNLTLFSVLGTVVLLLSAGAIGWREAVRRRDDVRYLYAMGLCLPVMLVAGIIGGTLVTQQNAIPLWTLAATILTGAAARAAGEASAAPRAVDAPPEPVRA
jgi:hypothetical protein